MGRKRIEILASLMLVAAILGVSPATAHVPPGACIERCLRECKTSGIGGAACFRYCPVHCLPPDTSTKEHNCNLSCMLDECAAYTKNEKRMTECVSNCRKSHCHLHG